MMIAVNFDKDLNQPNSSSPQELPTQYRGWSVYTSVIRGKIWIHWQNPRDPDLRYGCPMAEGNMDETIKHVRFLIDTSILLESKGGNWGKPEQNLEDTTG